MSAYIPTNVISITDGQIFLDLDLFNSGVRPAMNVGTSVSRVGGSAQTKAMKAVSGGLKLDLANFRELESFAAFGAELDKASQALIDRGRRLVELLKQANGKPMGVADQVVSIYAGTNGYLDAIPVDRVTEYEAAMLSFMRSEHADVLEEIRTTQKFEGDAATKTKAALDISTGLSEPRKKYFMAKDVGHYGIFNGRKWRERIAPVVEDWIKAND